MSSVIIFALLSKTDIWEAFIHHREPDNVHIYIWLLWVLVSWGPWDSQSSLWHVGSLVAACGI